MQTFVWGKEFYTGIREVDEQHHGLVDLINRLGETTIKNLGSNEAAIELAYNQMLSYAEHHFSVEVGIMRRNQVDQRHVAYHLQAHKDFITNLHAMWNSRAALNNPAEVFHAFLTSWLCLHVLGTDQALARQVKLIEQSETPEQAFDQEQRRKQDRSVEVMIKALRNTFQVLSRLSLDLISVNRSLDQRVSERTAELERANELLIVANQKLEVYSQTDGLLRIANRRYFDARLNDEWNRAIREQYSIGLLMIDVDYFKNYNDHYGHLAGDACLQAVAKAASSKMVRAIDLLARFGGEEFVVMLPSTDLDGAHKVALSICEAVSRLQIPHAASSVADHVTVSVGVASILPDRQSTTDQAVAAADQALYAAKQQGRNRVHMA